MNSLELTDKMEQLRIKADAIISGAEKESRKLTDDESASFNELIKEIEKAEEELRQINNTNQTDNNNKQLRKMENFSLLKAINAVANNKPLDERSAEMVNAGVAEMRKSGLSFNGQIQLPVEERADVQATVATAGMEAVATDKLNILEPLRANLVMA